MKHVKRFLALSLAAALLAGCVSCGNSDEKTSPTGGGSGVDSTGDGGTLRVLVTGTRLASGAVLSKTTFFNILPEKTTEIELVMRETNRINKEELELFEYKLAKYMYELKAHAKLNKHIDTEPSAAFRCLTEEPIPL